jgi:disulfide bond formation protein DsbB
MTEITTTEIADPSPRKGPSHLAFWLTACFILAYCGTLLGAFGVQFLQHEFPCPLCMLQRYAMILVTIPALWIMADALRGTLTRSRYARALGLSIIASIAGSVESTRQILLHIASKTDPGYGSAVLGLHLYTWALITFVIVIVYCGVMLLVIDTAVPAAPESPKLRILAKAVLWLFLGVIVANVVAIIFLEGFSWVLPDNPTNYRLLHELGLH